MQFERRSEQLELAGTTITVTELTTGEWEDVMALDEEEQTFGLIHRSVEGNPTKNDVMSWPRSAFDAVLSSVMAVNGLAEQGN